LLANLFTVLTLGAAVLFVAAPSVLAGAPIDGPSVRTMASSPVELRAGSSTVETRPILARSTSSDAFALSTQSAGASAPTADIQVTYEGFSTGARAAFEAAVSVWERRVVSSQVIRVNATWKPLAGGVLGSAGPTYVHLMSDNRWYPTPLFEALCGCDQVATDIQANFNSTFANWYLGTGGNGPSNKWDLRTVVMHELGHGLGFISSLTAEGSQGRWGYGGTSVYPTLFDTNEWTAAIGGTQLTDTSRYSNPSAALLTQLTDGSVYFGGSNVVAANGGRARLYAPPSWASGSSNSHFDEQAFPTGTRNALMTPNLASGEVIHEPGPLALALLRDIGWQTAASTVADNGAPTVRVPTVGVVAGVRVGSSATVAIEWAPANSSSGVASYTLQYKKGTGAWTTIALPSPTSTSLRFTVVPGKIYRFRLAATDLNGNSSAFATTPSARLVRAQETAATLTYSGSWQSASLAGAVGGTVSQTTGAGSVTYTFTGSHVAFVSALGTDRGAVGLWLDGAQIGIADLYAPALQTARVVWSGRVAPGTHTLTVRLTDGLNAASTGSRIDVDAFLVWK
jgi:hypothetical protein